MKATPNQAQKSIIFCRGPTNHLPPKQEESGGMVICKLLVLSL